jgi:pilus assembly protein FimV
MLYIIAGLVLILLVAGLLLRKNKAQKQSTQPPVNSGRNTATTMPKTDYGTPAHSNKNDDNKFDHVTIAQRFMDQQRYDKAIETINRGLSEKPNDGQLSIKLLSIYATMDQPENFNSVYDTIKMHNDPKTITLADELKGLYFEEQSPVVTQELPVEDTSNFDSLDFDLPTSQVDNTNVVSDRPVVEDSNDTVINEPIDNPTFSNEFDDASPTTENVEDSFDLTLSDLENDFNEPDATSENPVTPLVVADGEVLDTSTNDSADTIEDNDLSDFEFDFDSPAENTATGSSVISDVPNSESEELVLEDEDFILDFDDLAADADRDSAITNEIEETSIEAFQSSEDDFTLSLDSLDASNDIDTTSNNELPTIEENNDIDSFILEDTDFENATSESNTLEDDSFADIDLEEQLLTDNDTEVNPFEESNIAPAAPLRFDDNTLIDDDFSFNDIDSLSDSPETITPVSTAAPVELETDITTEEVESAEDFSSRFAADFDFVKSLDSHQVTLDLADQYLQLGEYDSAKRLLNEVIAQGNNEQKQQAQVLLDRTA